MAPDLTDATGLAGIWLGPILTLLLLFCRISEGYVNEYQQLYPWCVATISPSRNVNAKSGTIRLFIVVIFRSFPSIYIF
ncbi:hypothetical protein B0H14DRAFT_2912186 [Mycena olivaceomarginata]|nr:hypothetical protein B0H14DRAFT_2912186 [Mycena olivaceomarginata]